MGSSSISGTYGGPKNAERGSGGLRGVPQVSEPLHGISWKVQGIVGGTTGSQKRPRESPGRFRWYQDVSEGLATFSIYFWMCGISGVL